MTKARPHKVETSASEQGDSTLAQALFTGTENPRHLRAIHALLRRPMPREQLDREAGCSNGPELVAELRRRGLDVPCTKTPVIDRDGQEVKRGIYHFTEQDRRKVYRWQGSRQRGISQKGGKA